MKPSNNSNSSPKTMGCGCLIMLVAFFLFIYGVQQAGYGVITWSFLLFGVGFFGFIAGLIGKTADGVSNRIEQQQPPKKENTEVDQ